MNWEGLEQAVDNPVLRGFNPDPSLLEVDGVYYIATSTFEWFPGVQIFRSDNLIDWELFTRPLDEKRLLDLTGVPDSCGVWAPCLSHSQGTFYLAYTIVRRFDGHFKDSHNFITIAKDLCGPWSDPVFVNASGFDPSIFHDRSGQMWWLNMVWDHRPDRTPFKGIALQRLNSELQLEDDTKIIATGSDVGLIEGPHLYQFGSFYYLVVAEGGTGYGHCISIARSKVIEGPYEFDPLGPVITAKDDLSWPLQRSGHGALVHVGGDNYVMSFLCSRRINDGQHSPMGRESGLAHVVMTADGWIRQVNGAVLPPLSFPNDLAHKKCAPRRSFVDRFETSTLLPDYQWLRGDDLDRWCSLTARPGHLRLTGRESPGSLFEQSLLATRMTDGCCSIETCIEFKPTHFQAMAGLMIYYNSRKFHYLFISHEPELGKVLNIMSCLAVPSLCNHYPLSEEKILLGEGATFLRFDITATKARASYKETDDEDWQRIPVDLDMTYLTDQAGMASGEQFTGTFVGMAAHDVSGHGEIADFRYFAYEEAS